MCGVWGFWRGVGFCFGACGSRKGGRGGGGGGERGGRGERERPRPLWAPKPETLSAQRDRDLASRLKVIWKCRGAGERAGGGEERPRRVEVVLSRERALPFLLLLSSSLPARPPPRKTERTHTCKESAHAHPLTLSLRAILDALSPSHASLKAWPSLCPLRQFEKDRATTSSKQRPK